jgi:UDP-2,3-diacylglucosamine hydrolase
MGAAVFISDLHLSAEQPAVAGRFFALLDELAGRIDSLYILGDLLEMWIGDDELEEPFQASVARAIRRLSDTGAQVHVMHGNRDLLLGADFMIASGARALADPSRIDLFGEPTLLMHGDSLCTDDLAYQSYRAMVRDPDWQRAFLAKPYAERRAIAESIRQASLESKSGKSMAIMDVNPEAVRKVLIEHQCQRLIHGHTHRPAQHQLDIDGKPHVRWVLPDWYGDGGYLLCQASGCEFRLLANNPAAC